MLIIIQFEKEVVIMINRKLYSNDNLTFNLISAKSIFIPKTSYDSPTLMEIIFS